ncbi:23S rRNA (pseudouridine1915-N3)-methyltransferase [Breznakibacter xylanolyticus]|uniref:Ribosomal RNA large subunit methyltransferase H n=1 Tax=Breznakibacter xylanolyticus TaxID=990 RepID=A0A2W7NRF0_9BACT|nr:23S rRNA (pseudouridine(1915)-N(3))-methyltransferase RlmH [Breznakibacter xylanolyticus]MBN2743341.1 23S rRNA (pseudouridine(1915)-N(3))-methyltransferase RlmH [Marinilabiliaceae bacterium]PZX19184.1 23S rRNA (pseudouridine1915-N3)-methyltransferase [Breznakibacter xylanolyticus]
MKVTLIWIGKTVEPWLQAGIDEYTGRLKHYLPFEIKEIASVKNAKNLDESQLKQKEGELILSALQPGDHLVLLDENGKQPSSREFSTIIDKHQHGMVKRLVFVIGGAYGFSDAVYAAANSKMSLSRMTFSHQMVRVIFTEQLYRAMTILKGEPYHHD